MIYHELKSGGSPSRFHFTILTILNDTAAGPNPCLVDLVRLQEVVYASEVRLDNAAHLFKYSKDILFGLDQNLCFAVG